MLAMQRLVGDSQASRSAPEAPLKVCHRIAVVRRQVKQLAAVVAARAAQEESSGNRFRPLPESLVGGELLAAFGDERRCGY